MNGEIQVCGSTDSERLNLISQEYDKERYHFTLENTPLFKESPVLKFDIDVWSYNEPFMLIRHVTRNVGEEQIEDLKIYNIMDFDIGGPISYKDDMGLYNTDTGVIMVYDLSSLTVAMTGIPQPNGWDLDKPTSFKLEADRDLRGTTKLGPQDIATGLQWDLGNLDPCDSKKLEIVLVAAKCPNEVNSLIERAKNMFDKKMQ
ncbi:MAG: hypothetical protein BAJATHORv1_10196 [Candidatus Thorarchaeota archaeon]|nr:MAG: hypothetical protein BAJATHORv1_10196 [Candidatus Thorarchaeota archaeon]